MGYSPLDVKQSDMTEVMSIHRTKVFKITKFHKLKVVFVCSMRQSGDMAEHQVGAHNGSLFIREYSVYSLDVLYSLLERLVLV